MTEATEARDAALDLFEQHRAEWLAQARGTAHRLYRRLGRPITADDLRAECPLPAGWDRRVMGGVFVGWTPVGHGRPIQQFMPAGPPPAEPTTTEPEAVS